MRITELDTSRVRYVPLDILGAQLAVPTSDAPMTSGQVTITVVDAWVGSVNDIASWFGAPAPACSSCGCATTATVSSRLRC